ncbi:MAG: SusC/RagA family TonB-linked outer membrane protein [Bacteroides sp.]|nr:SusC/RagA family TonB-linked outer membrane protein [Bacteroides sp.]
MMRFCLLLACFLLGSTPVLAQGSANDVLTGYVKDRSGQPLPGVNVVLKDVKGTGVSTDVNGKFTLNLSGKRDVVFSFIGMKTKTVSVKSTNKPLIVVLEEDAVSLEGVVVNGYFTKKRESFTGSEITVSGEQLKDIGTPNLISSLSAFNPSLRVAEELEYGSDPNHIPEITLRGQSTFDLRGSAEGSRSNPNAPLYIMDGVEVSAETVYDYDINRIESTIILKDASATAIYGSRGANGVIVITTKRPTPGKIKVDFSANFTISVPDLRDYNLMNAAEKLEYERLAGVYIYPAGGMEGQMMYDELYNSRLQEVSRGVDTYWLSKPLQTALTQKYAATLEGGDNNLRYQLNLKYDKNEGVMKGSGRDNYGISTVLDYNVGENFRVRNELSITELTAKDSPYGSFSTYAQQNPYERIYDADGNFVEILSSTNEVNPMINASLPNLDRSKSTTWKDNFSLEWRFLDAFRLTSRLSFSRTTQKDETFLSPNSPIFQNETDVARKGKATFFNSTDQYIDGNIMLSYYKTFKDVHTVNVTAGANFTSSEYEGEGFTATGFLNDNLTNIYYAQQYEENSTPSASSDVSRLAGFLVNANYGYNEKYYLDFSLRTDGSSKFGSDSRFAPFWSVGLAWNVHKENFMNEDFATLKLRSSVGSTGNINFASSQAITKYYYYADNVYLDSWGATLQGYGNSNLKWQKTMSYNVGMDLTLFNGRIALYADVYKKLTDNLLLPMNVAPSTGFTSYTENVGKVENKGVEARMQVSWIRNKDFTWSTTFSAFHNKNKIKEISNELAAMNERNNTGDDSNVGGTVVNQYENGNSTTAIYVVRSNGIDPATGNEVYIKRDGSTTFVYDYKDKVVVGDTEPKVNGNLVNNIAWKGFNLYAVLTYRYGGQAYNSTLATKVEGADPVYNADKRVLYDRWKEPGDIATFRRIDDNSPVYQSSRFVQDNNSLVLSNLSLTYTVPQKYITRFGLEYMKLYASTTDLFRISSIKQERGTNYPYARSFSLGINLRF